MIYNRVGATRDPLKQYLAPGFCQNQKKVIRILTETHINHDQIHHTRNNWLGPIFFSPGDSHTKGMLFLLHLSLEGVTEVDTGPKERFVSFKVTNSNKSSLFVPLQAIAPNRAEQRGRFFEGLQNYMQNKNEGNENKIMLGDVKLYCG